MSGALVRVGGMSWPKTGVTHYHAQLGLLRQMPCNQRVICLKGKWTLYTAIIRRGVSRSRTRSETKPPKVYYKLRFCG